METNFCYRIDIDTWGGLQKGLPKCFELSQEFSFPFTYYLSLGPYATGRNLFRIIKKKESIVRKIPVWKRNHWKDLFRGVLIPPRRIGKNTIEKLLEYEADKLAEFHPHGYNHVVWASEFQNFDLETTSDYIKNIIGEYKQIFGKHPEANATPNFIVNQHYLNLIPKQFRFASDFRYHSPFTLTSNNGKESGSITQLPVTEETVESLILKGKNKGESFGFKSTAN